MAETSVISRLSNDTEASLVRSLLESYGIPVTVSSDSLARAVYPTNIGEVCLSVPEELREEAIRILDAHRAKETHRALYSMNGEGGPRADDGFGGDEERGADGAPAAGGDEGADAGDLTTPPTPRRDDVPE